MLVKPRYIAPVVAIHITDDLIAERGSYVIIKDNEKIEVMDASEAERLFDLRPSDPPTHDERLLKSVVAKVTKTKHRRTTEDYIIGAFGPDTAGIFLRDMSAETIAKILPKIPYASILVRLGALLRKKILSVRIVNGLSVYSLSSAGEAESKRLRGIYGKR